MSSTIDGHGRRSEPATTVDLVGRRAAERPSAIAYRYWPRGEPGDDTITYGRLAIDTATAAARLSRMARPGDRVILAVPPGLDFIVAFHATLTAGCVAVPVAPSGPGAALTVDDVAARCDAAVIIGSARSATGHDERPAVTVASLLADGAVAVDRWEPPRLGKDDLALLQYTSGSTGIPRGIMITHGNVMANLCALHQRLDPGPDSNGLLWLPPFHDMGLIGGVLMPLFEGRPMTLMSPRSFAARPIRWLRAIALTRCTHTAVPNFALDFCVDRTTEAERRALDLSPLRTVLCGAEPVQQRTLERFARAFQPAGFDPSAFVAAYGLAENTLMVTTSTVGSRPGSVTIDAASIPDGTVAPVAADHRRAVDLVSVGTAVDPTIVTVVDPATGRTCEPGRIGEIRVQGPSVAVGCWEDAESTDPVFAAGDNRELRTGDLGFVLDGRLFVTGRVDDVINIRGRKFHPEQLEETAAAALAGIGVVGQSVAVAVEHRGTRRLVFLQGLRGGASDDGPALERVILTIRASLARVHQVGVDEVLIVPIRSLPRTRSGKIRRSEIAGRVLDGTVRYHHRWSGPSAAADPETRSAGTGAANDRDDVIEWLQVAVSRMTGLAATEVGADSTFASLALDSLHVALLGHDIETRYGVDVITTNATTDTTIHSIVDLVLAAGQPEAAATGWREAHRRLSERMALLEEAGQHNPFQRTVHEVRGTDVEIGGRTVVNFASYDYLGLNGDPAVNRAAVAAIERYGTSVSASRVVSGDRPLHRDLEDAIARFLSVEAAVTFVSGGLTNISTIGHLVGPSDLIVHDSLAHNTIVAGAGLSGATRRAFPHNDIEALDRILNEAGQRFAQRLIVVEGVYSMDGDIPDLAALVEVAGRHNAMTMVDEAHSLGVIGSTGRGLSEHCRVDPGAVDVWMGTLSKSLAACGGYIAGSSALIDYLRYTSPGFVFSVGLSPPDAAAALAALGRLDQEPGRVHTLADRSALLRRALADRGVTPAGSPGTAVVPVVIGDDASTILISNRMLELGFNVPPIVAPAVAEREARLRFFVSAGHTEPQIVAAADALARALAEHAAR